MSLSHNRSDIDGLRALAVVPVVLFHAGGSFMPGGFIGVDVFFVISGYLITKTLLAEAEQGRLSILSFYERRIRRIAPALLTVLLTSMVVAHFLLLPRQYEDFSWSVLATEGFVSNFWFWSQTGYFKAQGGITPLLHTWSLAVEEQFYLFIPLIIMALARWRRALIAILILGALGSFALSVAGVVISPSATFYLLPTRAWELLVGSLLAANILPQITQGRGLIGWGGIVLISTSVLLLTEDMPFPGPLALPAVLGTAAVIYANSGSSSALLSTPVLRWIGWISYSLYLWHWPVVIFMRQFLIGDLNLAASVVAVFLSFALAAATFYFVEKPTATPRTSACF